MSGCCSADGYGFAPRNSLKEKNFLNFFINYSRPNFPKLYSWIKSEGQGTLAKMRKSIADMTLKYDYRNESYSGLLYAYTGRRLKPSYF